MTTGSPFCFVDTGRVSSTVTEQQQKSRQLPVKEAPQSWRLPRSQSFLRDPNIDNYASHHSLPSFQVSCKQTGISSHCHHIFSHFPSCDDQRALIYTHTVMVGVGQPNVHLAGYLDKKHNIAGSRVKVIHMFLLQWDTNPQPEDGSDNRQHPLTFWHRTLPRFLTA